MPTLGLSSSTTSHASTHTYENSDQKFMRKCYICPYELVSLSSMYRAVSKADEIRHSCIRRCWHQKTLDTSNCLNVPLMCRFEPVPCNFVWKNIPEYINYRTKKIGINTGRHSIQHVKQWIIRRLKIYQLFTEGWRLFVFLCIRMAFNMWMRKFVDKMKRLGAAVWALIFRSFNWSWS